MSTPITEFESAAAPFTAVVAAAGSDPAAWEAPSPCAGWSARDVLDHVVDSERAFLDKHGADVGLRPTGSAPEVWAAHLATATAAVGGAGFVEQEYDGHFGPTSVGETLVDFYGFDLLVHRWDLGRALGREVTWTEAEMDRIEAAAAGFGPALHADGVCGPALDVTDEAPRQTRVLARLGRRA